MLKQRLLTALVLLPLFVWAVLAMPLPWFAFLLGIIVIQGAWEWTALMGLGKISARLAYCTVIALCLVILWYTAAMQSFLLLGSLWWLVATPIVMSYPQSTRVWQNQGIQAVIGALVLLPCWVAVLYLKGFQQSSGYWLLLLLVVIWAADSGAYFSGRRFGKHKLAPAVSPGKTWEGVIGGLLSAVLLAIIALTFGSDVLPSHFALVILLVVVTVFFSILGDLFESMFKRHVGVKDSGRLLPGHGGVLDRIDSVTAAAPVFAFGLTLIASFFTFPPH